MKIKRANIKRPYAWNTPPDQNEQARNANKNIQKKLNRRAEESFSVLFSIYAIFIFPFERTHVRDYKEISQQRTCEGWEGGRENTPEKAPGEKCAAIGKYKVKKRLSIFQKIICATFARLEGCVYMENGVLMTTHTPRPLYK